MATFHRFEELQAWQKARELTCEVYRATRAGAFSRDRALRDQIRRAAISVTSNIAEGFERNSSVAFAHFLSIAEGSAGEVRSQLYVALEEATSTTAASTGCSPLPPPPSTSSAA
jgi:four helix bundle protein